MTQRQARFSSLTTDMLRVLQMLENPHASEPPAETVPQAALTVCAVHKHLLHRPRPAELLLFLAAAAHERTPDGVLLLYLSAEPDATDTIFPAAADLAPFARLCPMIVVVDGVAAPDLLAPPAAAAGAAQLPYFAIVNTCPTHGSLTRACASPLAAFLNGWQGGLEDEEEEEEKKQRKKNKEKE
jgi:hypothetical protein